MLSDNPDPIPHPLPAPTRRPRSAFVHDLSGVAAVEFAFIALPFLMLVFGIAENSFDLFLRSNLDVAAQKAARQIQVGNVQQQGLAAADFGQLACSYLPRFMSCANLVFSVQTVGSSFYQFSTPYTASNGLTQYSINPPSLSQGQNPFCPGKSNQYVVVQFLYAVPAITGVWLTSSVTYNGNRVRVLSANQVLRNEAFPSVDASTGC